MKYQATRGLHAKVIIICIGANFLLADMRSVSAQDNIIIESLFNKLETETNQEERSVILKRIREQKKTSVCLEIKKSLELMKNYKAALYLITQGFSDNSLIEPIVDFTSKAEGNLLLLCLNTLKAMPNEKYTSLIITNSINKDYSSFKRIRIENRYEDQYTTVFTTSLEVLYLITNGEVGIEHPRKDIEYSNKFKEAYKLELVSWLEARNCRATPIKYENILKHLQVIRKPSTVESYEASMKALSAMEKPEMLSGMAYSLEQNIDADNTLFYLSERLSNEPSLTYYIWKHLGSSDKTLYLALKAARKNESKLYIRRVLMESIQSPYFERERVRIGRRYEVYYKSAFAEGAQLLHSLTNGRIGLENVRDSVLIEKNARDEHIQCWEELYLK